MAILNPSHLLDQAERLLIPRERGLVRQADRRRAISAAYYAVFHAVLAEVADEFVGRTERRAPRYTLAYRAVDHRGLESLCVEVAKPQPGKKYVPYFPEGGFNRAMREFATLIVELKEKRNTADYDPSLWVNRADAKNSISSARTAIKQFGEAPLADKKIFLTLLVFPPRLA